MHIAGMENILKSGSSAAGIGVSDGCDLHITAESENEEDRDAYLDNWIDKVKENYVVNIGVYEVGGFNDF